MTQTPAGWYTDPQTSPGAPPGPSLRYWDGAQWTEHVAPAPPPHHGRRVPTTPDGEVLAGWWMRVLATIVDALILLPVTLLAAAPALVWLAREMEGVQRQAEAAAAAGAVDPFAGVEMPWGPPLALMAVMMVVTLVYHGAFLRWKSRTPGKMVVGLRVRLRDSPGRLPWSAVGLRLLVQQGPSALGSIPFLALAGLFPLLDVLWPLWDDKNQALHDKAARTNVVRDGVYA